MGKRMDISGKKFNRVTALKISSTEKNSRKILWDCICECGVKFTCVGSNLVSGCTKSCGCLKKEKTKEANFKHGRNQNDPTYLSWYAMKTRCQKNPRYISRGIIVCERWKNSFVNFLQDMGERPIGHTLDRINNDGHYQPENCRWATPTTQRRNNSQLRLIEIDGVKMILNDWAQKSGIAALVIHKRLKRGWSEKDAVFTQSSYRNHNQRGNQ